MAEAVRAAAMAAEASAAAAEAHAWAVGDTREACQALAWVAESLAEE
jgi:hypothetical protein